MTDFKQLVALHSKSPLLAVHLYNFNFCPAKYIHATRQAEFDGGKLSCNVWQTDRAHPMLSAHVLRLLGIENDYCLDPTYVEWPLLLLSQNRLERIKRHVAAVIFNPLIRRSIVSADVIKWKHRLGSDAYKFALTGTTLLPRLDYFPHFDDESQFDSLCTGWLEAAMATAAQPLKLRAMLKLPLNSILPHVETVSARRLVYALISILEPEWRSLFSAIRK